MKKLFSTFLASAFVFMGVHAQSFYVDGICYIPMQEQGWQQSVYVTEKADGTKYAGEVYIPDSVTYNNVGYKVLGIGDNSFKDCVDITKVTMGGELAFIGNSAFEGCSGIKSITIATTKQWQDSHYCSNYIGYRAFKGCHLDSVTCLSIVPPTFSYSNPSNNWNSSSYYCQWFEEAWHGGWKAYELSSYTTLRVPAGSIGLYRNIDTNNVASGMWDKFKNVVEWGADEGDDVPELYTLADDLQEILTHLEDSVMSMNDYAMFFVDSLLMSQDENLDWEQVQAQAHDYFVWVQKEYSWNTVEVPFIPDFYQMFDKFSNTLTTAVETLDGIKEKRAEFYGWKSEVERTMGDLRTKLESTADETERMYLEQVLAMQEKVYSEELGEKKSELDSKISEARNLLFRTATEFAYIMENDVLEPILREFLANIKVTITAVPSIVIDSPQASSVWYSLDGRRQSQKPTKSGVYIVNGKKLLVK